MYMIYAYTYIETDMCIYVYIYIANMFINNRLNQSVVIFSCVF